MNYHNHNEMAEAIILSRGNIPEIPAPFHVPISNMEVSILKKIANQSSDKEKYFRFQGKDYNWWIYFSNNKPAIKVVPKKEDNQMSLEFNANTANQLVRLARILDRECLYAEADRLTEILERAIF